MNLFAWLNEKLCPDLPILRSDEFDVACNWWRYNGEPVLTVEDFYEAEPVSK